MIKTKRVTEVFGMPVYTDEGFYYGDVEEAVLQGNKVAGWRIKATRNSHLSRVLGGAKGVTVPHQLVRSIGDILIISKSAMPAPDEESSAPNKDSGVEEF